MQVRDCRCRKAFAALAETVSRTAAGWIAVCCFAATAALGEVVQTGAAQSKVGADEVYTWSKNGSVTIPEGGLIVDLLVVGGGGGGGGQGGGGGGGVAYYRKIPLAAGTYAVTIGAGGNAASNSGSGTAFNAGSTGGVSRFGSICAVLGGSGGGGWDADAKKDGANGGGGSTVDASNVSNPTQIPSGKSRMKGSAGVKADGQVGTGHAGGNATNHGSSETGNGGGGGGAGADADGQHSQVFTVANNNDATAGEHAGNGGDGYACSITGAETYYGGGGGGGIRRSNYKRGGIGGKGGGGNGSGGTPHGEVGAGTVYAGSDGTDGLGGGGGAAGWDSAGTSRAAGRGGSGVVILRVHTGKKVSVTSVTCTRHSPWDGKVDVDYELTADDPTQDIWVYPIGHDDSGERTIPLLRTSGDGAEAPVKPGRHRMTVDVDAAAPGLSSAAFTVKIFALAGGAPYLVVDLSGGADATNYPVSYLPAVPQGGWTDEYKTTKLVLRLIPPGTFMMGSPTTELGRETGETLHAVTLTKPFYIGIFELTQSQWKLVMGTDPSSRKGALRPVETISFVTLRGNVDGTAWPIHDQVDEDSFIGRLRRRASMDFDLPTEAQWEYACRAGTTTALYTGKNLSSTTVCPNVAEVARYRKNQSDGRGGYAQHAVVGSYLPNAWGLYDMIGNLAEICVDQWKSDLGTAAVIDPVGASNNRQTRSGHSSAGETDDAFRCRAARRFGRSVTAADNLNGARIICRPIVR